LRGAGGAHGGGAWPPDLPGPLSYVTRSLLMCSAQPLLPSLPLNGSLCCSRLFSSRRPQHKHKHRLCPEWLAASVCTPSLHEYARGMPPTANPCIASSDADADTASASPLTQSPRLAARSSQLAACSLQRPKPTSSPNPSHHGSVCVCVTVTVIRTVSVCVRAPHLPRHICLHKGQRPCRRLFLTVSHASKPLSSNTYSITPCLISLRAPL
jgi:hypothetical protein